MQLIAHCGLFYQIMNPDALSWIASLFVFFLFQCVGLTMTLHRWLSHNGWNPPAWFRPIGIGLATLSLMGPPLSWIALHRYHHKNTDQKEDPHSPLHNSFPKLIWLIMFCPFPNSLLGKVQHMGLLSFVQKWYFHIHSLLMATTLIYPSLMVKIYLAPAALNWLAAGAVVTLNHSYGYRNFNTLDNSKNLLLTGYLTFGEGWHNNHHHSPTSTLFSKNWWEIDVGGLIINCIRLDK